MEQKWTIQIGKEEIPSIYSSNTRGKYLVINLTKVKYLYAEN